MKLPPYNTASGLGFAGGTSPPFTFDGTSARVFPVKANMARLANFCDAYLNRCHLEGHRFRAFVPYVYVMILDYGKMAIDQANAGWIAQKEVTFTVPLEWYEERPVGSGRWAFRDWAVVSPFIFVDDPTSLTTGREVYGWPKVEAWLEPSLDAWIKHPSDPRRVMRLETMIFAETYAGARAEPRPLMDVVYGPAPALWQVPTNLSRGQSLVGNPLRTLQASMDLAADLAEVMFPLPILGYEPQSDPVDWWARLEAGLRHLSPLADRLYTHQINLKEFRDSEVPDRACYQAIVESEMVVRRLNAGGLLGDPFVRRGDPTGGYRLEIHRTSSQPIVESLGLEVESETEIHGRTVSTLMPAFPFWLDMDLEYGAGRIITEYGKTGDPVDGRVAEEPLGRPELSDGGTVGNAPRFNTARAGASQQIVGPFEFPNSTVRVLPLQADRARLERLCAEYLPAEPFRFRPFGDVVYLLATTHEEMSSKTNSVGFWAESEVEILVPVYWSRVEDGVESLLSVALVPIHVFVDSSTAAITGREVNGRPAVRADIRRPADVWMAPSGPIAPRRCLDVVVQIIPALGLGQKAERRQLLSVIAGEEIPGFAGDDLQHMVDAWEETRDRLREDRRERAEANEDLLVRLEGFAFEILGDDLRLNLVHLKQFRDAEHPDLACYQALVHLWRTVRWIHDLRPLGPLHVAIREYPALPIAETLGLVPKLSRIEQGVMTHYYEPLEPFWMRVRYAESLGVDCAFRTASREWESDGGSRHGDLLLERDGPLGLSRRQVEEVEREAAARVGDGDETIWHHLRQAMDAVEAQGMPESDRGELSTEEVARALEVLDPQTVLEALARWARGARGETPVARADPSP
jgi:hypothetical protein